MYLYVYSNVSNGNVKTWSSVEAVDWAIVRDKFGLTDDFKVTNYPDWPYLSYSGSVVVHYKYDPNGGVL